MTRKPKPCNRCVGAEITWLNADDFEFCTEHQAEVMKEINARAAEMSKRIIATGSDSLQ